MKFPLRLLCRAVFGLLALSTALRGDPAITTQPANQSVVSGASATFTVAATGAGTLTYQWQRNGLDLTGATAATLTINPAARADADFYSVVVNDTSGVPTPSTTARLSVAPVANTYPDLIVTDASLAPLLETDTSISVPFFQALAAIPADAPFAPGGFYVAGNFLSIDGVRRLRLARFLANGTVDPAFASPEVSDTIRAVAVQPDGKVVIGGDFFQIGAVAVNRFARLNSDGSLDTAFAAALGTGPTNSVNALVLQTDGAVILGGNFGFVSGVNRGFVARVSATGALDLNYNPNANQPVLALVRQSDGKLLLGGNFTTMGGVARVRVARVNNDATGTLDPTFDTGVNGPAASVLALALDTAGNVYAGGNFTTFGAANTVVNRLVRLTSVGALDSAWTAASVLNAQVNTLLAQADGTLLVGISTTGGFLRLTSTGVSDAAYNAAKPNGFVFAVAAQADGKIVISGNFGGVGGANRPMVARLSADLNTIDPTVAASPSLAIRGPGIVRVIAHAPGGKTYVAGIFTHLGGNPVNRLVRYNADGTLDTAFAAALGSGPNLWVDRLVVQGDGKVVIAGQFNFVNGTARQAFARLNADGSLDTTFIPSVTGPSTTANLFLVALPGGRTLVTGAFTSIGGQTRAGVAILTATGAVDTTFNPVPASPSVVSAALQPDGKILIGGTFASVGGTASANLARINNDATGTVDTAFSSALVSGPNFSVEAITVQPDGRILLGGNFTIVGGSTRTRVARLLATGVLDTSFLAATGPNGTVNEILVQPSDGKLLLRGGFSSVNNVANTQSFARLNADSSLDTAFLGANPPQTGPFAAGAFLLTDSGRLQYGVNTAAGFARNYGTFATGSTPAITAQPANQTAAVGGAVSFTVVNTGAPAASYQWSLNGIPIPGATAATYTIASAQVANAGSYTVAVTNAFGSVTSAAATLSGPAAAPAITTQPVATNATVGGNAILTVAATGSSLTYQWRRNGTAIAGANAASFTLTGVRQTDSDRYDVVVAEGLTTTVSAPALLSVAPTTYPNGLALDAAFSLNLESTLSGTGAIRAVVRSGSQFYVAGDFTRIGGTAASRVARFNVDGTLDTAFSASLFDGLIRALAVQADGKVVVGGDFGAVGGQSRTRLARLNTNGSVDTAFVGFNGTNGQIHALAIQSDQKILVGGGFFNFGGANRVVLGRLNTDGTPDLTYDAQILGGGQVNALLLLVDGRLVAGGTFTTIAGNTRNGIAILLATGALDTSFAPSPGTGFGVVQNTGVGVASLALDANGLLLVGGNFTTFNGSPQNRLARLTLAGALDGNFGVVAGPSNTVITILPVAGGGAFIGGSFSTYNATARTGLALLTNSGALDATFAATTVVTGSASTVNALALDSAGALVVGGDFTTLAASARNRLGRVFATTGTLDTTLNPIAAEFPASAFAVAAQPGGKFLVLSNATRVGGAAVPPGLFRLNADLTLDTDFNSGGAGLVFNGSVGPFASLRLLVAPDGKAYVGAPLTFYNGTARSGLVRVNADGTLDTAFAVGTGFNNPVGNAPVTSLALLPGGQLLVGGNFTTYQGIAANSLVRLDANGTRDSAFTSPAAAVISGTGASSGLVTALASDGKIYLGGNFTSLSAPTATPRSRIARLNANGTLDTSFDPASGANTTVTALTVLADGRLLVGGGFNFMDGVARLGAARLLATGAVDRTFGGPLTNSTFGGVNAFTVQPDGSILQRGGIVGASIAPVVAGLTAVTTSSFGFTRLSADGQPQSSVSVSGVGTLVQDSNVILDNGRVLVAHVNPSITVTGEARTGLTLLVPQVGPGPGGTLRPVFIAAGQNSASSTVFAGNVTGAVTYQWRKNGTALAPALDRLVGTNSRQLYWINAQASDAGTYDCVVTDTGGTFTTNSFTVTVGAAAPTVSVPSVSTAAVSSTSSPGLTYVEGTPVILNAGATGTAPLTYQWQLNAVDVSGATRPVLDLGLLTAANAGAYTLKVTNSVAPAGVSSSAITLTLANAGAVAPVILQNPTQQTAVLGSPGFRRVIAGGTGSLSYQWKKDGNPIAGATASTLIIASTTLADAGLYSVDVTNAVSTTASAAARLTIGNPSVWTWRHALPFGGAYTKAAFGAGRYVAVGFAGAISTSADGVTWSLLGQFGSAYNDVVFAAGRFVAVGFNGTIGTSADGLTWARRNLGLESVFSSVLHDGTRFVAVGSSSTVYTSTDAVTWTKRAEPLAPAPTAIDYLASVAFGNGTYVALTGDSAYTSIDLDTWTARPFTARTTRFRAVTFSDGTFYAVGNAGAFARSTDNGATWTAGSVDSINSSFSENWVSVAGSGTSLVAANESGSLATSTDGLAWSIVANFPVGLANFLGVSYVNNRFIAVGNGGMIFTSADGLAWTQRSTNPLGLAQFNAVTSGTSGFVAVGNNGRIASSPDGQNWTARDSGNAAIYGGVAFGNARYVAVSGALISNSADGATWSSVNTANNTALSAVAYDGSQFVAVGNGGRVTTSPDALTWSARTSGQTTALRGIATGAGALVAVGDTALVIRSTDTGITWSPQTVPAPLGSTTSLLAVTFAGGQFLAVGLDQVGAILSTVILTSPDGAAWTRREVPYTQSARAITYANGRYIVGGGTASILSSADGITWTSEAANNSQLVLGLANSAAGTVAVSTAGGIQFASNSPAPAVTAASPTASSAGTTVTLTGTGFTGATGAAFNGVAATSFTVVNDTTATAVTPASFATGPVTVTGPGGTSLPTVGYTFVAAPAITTQPAALTVNQDAGATFTVVATGGGTLAYQWSKTGTFISGATSASFTIASAQLADAVGYTVVVSNAGGTVTSAPATLTVNPKPVIILQPASVTVADGSAATFSVTATGAVSFQWLKGGVNVAGATGSSFVISAARPADGATYTVAVTNAAGTTLSAGATLAITPSAPVPLVLGAFGRGLPAGSNQILTANLIAGSLPVTVYQWKKDGADIVGATGPALLLANGQPSDNGLYSVAITNSRGTATSTGAVAGSTSLNQFFSPEAGWKWRNPLPSGNGFSDIKFINGQFIMGGLRGGLYTSPDGVNWTQRRVPSNSNQYGIGFANGQYVLTGGLLGIYTSPDLVVWTPRSAGIATVPDSLVAFQGLAQSPTRYVLSLNKTTPDGATLTSTDGVTWTSGNVGVAENLTFPSYANGQFWIGSNTVAGKIFRSADGLTWTSVDIPGAGTGRVTRVVFGVGRHVASLSNGNLASSVDGVTWALAPNGGNTNGLVSVAFENNLFVAGGNGGTVFTSADGLAWTLRTTGTTDSIRAVSYGAGIYVAAGQAGRNILTSPDGVAWTSQVTGPARGTNLRGVAANGATVVTVGVNGTILRSTDTAATWAAVTSVTTQHLNRVAFGAGLFVAAGGNGTLLSSADGSAWTAGTTGTTAAFNAVRFLNGQFVATGNGGVLRTSANGTTWTTGSTGLTNPLFGSAFGASTYVIVGGGGTLLSSVDGTAWTNRTTGSFTQQFNDVEFGAGLFVAVGQQGQTATSADGAAWTARSGFTTEALTSVRFIGGQFIATGSSQTYWVSADGITWTARTNGSFDNLLDTASLGSAGVVGVGDFGTILTAGAPEVAGPSNVTVTAPGAAELRVLAAASASTVTYQWKKNLVDIGGATSPVLLLATTSVADSGDYSVVATNSVGSTTSAAATLTVNPAPVAPTLTTQPATQVVNAGSNVTFTVVATGTSPIAYQWKKGGVDVPGATLPTLTLSGVQLADAGNYTVVVTNPVTGVTSGTAVLTVNAVAPTITTQPASTTVNAGASANFIVVATGTAPFTYQWQKGGVGIPAATGASYAIANTALADAGSFSVVVTNSGGSVSSAAATLTVNAIAPAITTQPVAQTVTAPASATFSVVATGTGPLAYVWRLGGAPISGATSASYTTGIAGVYSVVVTGPSGAIATSASAALTVNQPIVPVTFANPASVTVNAGSAFQFAVSPAGTLPITYQWFRNNALISGANGSSYGLASASVGDAGSYTVTVTNPAGSVTSAAATLAVNVPVVAPTVSAPASQTVAFGAPVSFGVTAGGTAPFTYQWLRNAAIIPGANAAAYTIAAAQLSDAASYTVTVTNAVTSVTSAAATLIVSSAAPVIASQPAAVTVLAGATASFAVSASGAPPLSYAWTRNGVVLPAFTGPAITITGVTALSAGTYAVTVSNGAGSTPSAPATLTVNTPPIITTAPVAQTATVGDNVTFTAAATGSGTLAFQWSLAGAPIAGATSATLALPAVALTASGNYAVTVTSAFGTVTGTPALLTVRAAQIAPSITTQPVAASVVTGSTATFAVVAAGSAPLTYQWRKDGVNLAGAVGATLTIPNTQPVAAGAYSVVVTNNVSTVTGAAAALTVTAPVVPPVVNSAATAPGGLGVPFAYLITATNTPSSFNATGLPAGLTVNPATGVVSGTPTLAGASTITLSATNSAGTGTLALTFTVAQPVPVVTSAAVATGRAGVAFTYTAAATNTPASFAASGLPAGLSISAAGLISGTPTASGTFNATLTATNAGGTGAAFPVTFTISAAATVPVVTSAPVATGRAGEAFTYTITASNSPTGFSAAPLPGGLTLNAGGLITGTPAAAGRFTINVTATNADGTSAPLGVQVTISPSALSPVITSSSTAGGTAGSAFAYTISASNTPTAFTAAPLPAGLAVNAASGAITGVPTAPGEFIIILGASNAAGAAAPRVLTLTVAPGLAAPAITSSSAASGRVGVAFAYSTAATNTPTSFTATGLPAGLAIDAASGVISGVPAAAGSFVVRLTAANVGGAGAVFTLTLTIDPAASAPAITSLASALATSGTLFTYQMVATNGPILSYAAAGLPAGLAINPASGLITGTPTVAGLFNVTLTATNVAGSSAPLALLLNVRPSALSPVVTSASTATATQGSAFFSVVTASNMPATVPLPAGNGYAATGLPDGLALNAATGIIAGTPTATGSFTVLLTATNDAGTSAPRTLVIVVRASLAAPVITSSNNAAATANAPFSYQIRGTNNPTSFDAANRPAWLAIDTATGVLSGTPPVPGVFTATLTAANAAGTGAPVVLTINATPAAGSPVITSGLFAGGTAGTAFTTALGAINGPITNWFAIGLPAGLALNPASGVVSGTPAVPGVFRVEVWAVNAIGTGGSRFLTLNFAAAAGTPVIGIGAGATVDEDPASGRRAAAALAEDYAEFRALADGDAKLISAGSRQLAAAAGLTVTGTVGESFSYQISAGGSPSGYTAAGLPAGLSLNPTTGLISGSPTVAGVFDAEIGASNALGVGASSPFTVTIRPPASTPTVTSAVTAAGTVGTAFAYQIAANNSPVSFNAAGLPDGLSVDSATGAVSGTPVTPGAFKLRVSANNATGSGGDTEVVVTLSAAAGAPVVTSAASTTGAIGAALNYQAAASGGVTAWSATNLPAGVDIDPVTGLVSGTPAVSGTFNATLSARNTTGLGAPFALRLAVAPSAATSAVTSATAATLAPGGAFTYQIAAGNTPVSYNAEGLPVGLTLNATTGVISGTVATAGTYVVGVSANNAAGTGPVTTFTLTVAGNAVVQTSTLSNISTRTIVGTGARVLISGFVITGTDPKPVLIRAVGPTLGQFNLGGLLADPVLELFRSDDTSFASNDTWGSAGDAAALAATAVRVGAFVLPNGSPEAVILTNLAPGRYTAQVRGAAGATGVGLVEVYDAGSGTENSRIINLSSRGEAGAGAGTMIAGFVIRGTVPKQVLIRGIGPTLAAFNVAGAMVDPRLQLFRGTTVINENDNWTDPALAAAASASGAFALAPGSRDAAILVTLEPGAYTAQISGVGTATGIALVEVYEMP